MPNEVWAVWPSVSMSQADENARRWKAAGYRTAVLVDSAVVKPLEPDLVLVGGDWRGYSHAVNCLSHKVDGDVVVCVGDDIWPAGEAGPQAILGQFRERFPSLVGVMQPAGDEYGSIHECAPSPWIGRGFIEHAYENGGPYWEGYYHYFCDQELKEVAERAGVFWPRQDLCQYHDHWERRREERPDHLLRALKRWKFDKAIFEERRLKGFPGTMLCH